MTGVCEICYNLTGWLIKGNVMLRQTQLNGATQAAERKRAFRCILRYMNDCKTMKPDCVPDGTAKPIQAFGDEVGNAV